MGTVYPFLSLHPSGKGQERQNEKNKNKFVKYLRRVIKRKSCHLVPRVVIDLPFEGRKVERSWKCRRRERVPKAGSRREETITLSTTHCLSVMRERESYIPLTPSLTGDSNIMREPKTKVCPPSYHCQ